MKYGYIPGLNKPVSRIVMGMGTRLLDEPDHAIQLSVMDASLESGVNTFDTGRHYGDGLADYRLGKWLKNKNRDDFVIISKGAHPNKIPRGRVTPYDIRADIADSLTLLDTPYVDIFMLHRDDPGQDVGQIVECLNDIQKQGLAKTIGVSNWNLNRLKKASEYAEKHGLAPLKISSVHYSLAAQHDDPWGGCFSITNDPESQEWYCENQITLLAYASLSMGLLSGRVHRHQIQIALEQGIIDEDCIRCYCHGDNFDRLDRSRELAERKGVGIATLALSFVLNSKKLTGIDSYALVGSASPQEAWANAEAMELELAEDELLWLLHGYK